MAADRAGRRSIAGRVFLALALLGAARLEAQDLVVLRTPPGASGNPKLVGEILDIDARELRLRLASGSERRVAIDQVLSASTTRSPAQRVGDERFAERDYAGAVKQYRAALQSPGESRAWARRSILAQLIWCYRALDDDELAARTFVEALLPSDPQGSQFDCIPLCWRPKQTTLGLERAAGEWLRSDKSAWAALVGASYLFSSKDQGVAIERLKRLTRDSDRRLSWLAEAQLWRQSLVADSQERLLERLANIDTCPEAFRAGPYYLIGAALLKSRPDDGALALMRLPILYPRERSLAAAALGAVAQSFQERGKSTDSARLYRELMDQYAGTTEAGVAATRLNPERREP